MRGSNAFRRPLEHAPCRDLPFESQGLIEPTILQMSAAFFFPLFFTCFLLYWLAVGFKESNPTQTCGDELSRLFHIFVCPKWLSPLVGITFDSGSEDAKVLTTILSHLPECCNCKNEAAGIKYQPSHGAMWILHLSILHISMVSLISVSTSLSFLK